jgi:hypothetical protein
VAKALGLGGCELAVEAQEPRPAEELLCDQRDLKPGLVVTEGVVWQVAHAGVLAGADAVLDARVAAVAQLKAGDALACLIGEKARVAKALAVEDLKLRTGVRAS